MARADDGRSGSRPSGGASRHRSDHTWSLGRYHGPRGATSLRHFTERDPLVPLTDATIAYVVGGILEVIDASTLIVNRELASWYRETDASSDPSLISYPQRDPPRTSEPDGPAFSPSASKNRELDARSRVSAKAAGSR